MSLTFDPAQIIAQEGMDAASVGPMSSLTVTDDGRLADDGASEEAFRAQVEIRRAESARVDHEITSAREEVADRTDGPICAFVLISRACLGAAQHPDRPYAYAAAVYQELISRGWVNATEMEVTGS